MYICRMINVKIKEEKLAKKFSALRVKISKSTLEYHISDIKKYIERKEKDNSQQRSCNYIVIMTSMHKNNIKEVKYYFDVYQKAYDMHMCFRDKSSLEVTNFQLN